MNKKRIKEYKVSNTEGTNTEGNSRDINQYAYLCDMCDFKGKNEGTLKKHKNKQKKTCTKQT